MNEATFTVGPDDLIAANRFHFKNLFSAKRWTLAMLVSGIAVALLIYGVDLGFESKDYLYMLAVIWGIVIAICILGWIAIPRQTRRSWSQAKRLWIDTNVRWDSDGIHFENARGNSHVPWTDYHRWAADERNILLYQDDRSFFTLPLRQFPSNARDTITDYLKKAGVQVR